MPYEAPLGRDGAGPGLADGVVLPAEVRPIAGDGDRRGGAVWSIFPENTVKALPETSLANSHERTCARESYKFMFSGGTVGPAWSMWKT